MSVLTTHITVTTTQTVLIILVATRVNASKALKEMATLAQVSSTETNEQINLKDLTVLSLKAM